MKTCFLITSYCNTDQKIEALIDCIDNLRTISNNDIFVHAHYPIDIEIQKKVNFYMYDSSNPLLKYPEKYINFWKKIGKFTTHIYKDDFGYTVLQAWRRGFDFLKNLYENIIVMNYDVFITKNLLDKIENKIDYDGCTFLHPNLSTICTLNTIKSNVNVFNKISLSEYKRVTINGFAEDFAKYIYDDENYNFYNFKYDEYKDDFYTTMEVENLKSKSSKLEPDHNLPYDSMIFDNFDIFLGENNNILNILFYNVSSNLNIQIYYNKVEIFDNIINTNVYFINTEIKFDQLDIKKLNIIINNEKLKIDNFPPINSCKIIY